MTFHDRIDQEKYRSNPITMGRVTFYDASGAEVLTGTFRIIGKSPSKDETSDREYQTQMRVGEKFREALCRLGILSK